MPVPGGEITTSEILIPVTQVEAAVEAALAAEEAEDDLPEMS
jgi:hypothetical protein